MWRLTLLIKFSSHYCVHQNRIKKTEKITFTVHLWVNISCSWSVPNNFTVRDSTVTNFKISLEDKLFLKHLRFNVLLLWGGKVLKFYIDGWRWLADQQIRLTEQFVFCGILFLLLWSYSFKMLWGYWNRYLHKEHLQASFSKIG